MTLIDVLSYGVLSKRRIGKYETNGRQDVYIDFIYLSLYYWWHIHIGKSHGYLYQCFCFCVFLLKCLLGLNPRSTFDRCNILRFICFRSIRFELFWFLSYFRAIRTIHRIDCVFVQISLYNCSIFKRTQQNVESFSVSSVVLIENKHVFAKYASQQTFCLIFTHWHCDVIEFERHLSVTFGRFVFFLCVITLLLRYLLTLLVLCRNFSSLKQFSEISFEFPIPFSGYFPSSSFNFH